MTGKKLVVIAFCLAVFCAVLYLGSVPGLPVDVSNPRSIEESIGIATLLPPVLAVVLAFLIKDVTLSLLAGFVAGAAMLAAVSRPSGIIEGVFLTFTDCCSRVLDTICDRDNCAVILLCLVIGGMVEVIRRSGGFEALARIMLKKIDTPKKANLVGELLGIIVFFDDYANSLIVGPLMRPVTDKLNVSREKLAYLVDSTAAPVTGIAIISSWVAVEVSVIEQGFAAAGISASGYNTFVQSIPYCFYCIFCLVFIFESSLMGREYGPMLAAERRARGGRPYRGGAAGGDAETEGNTAYDRQWQRIVTAIVPIVLLCTIALLSFYICGRKAAVQSGILPPDAGFNLKTIAAAFGAADTIYLVMESAVAGSAAAIILGCAFHLFQLKESVQYWLQGAATMLITAVILVLAWSLAGTVEELGTIYYVVSLISLNVPWWLIPSLIFMSCCVISFAAGSYGCMFIAMPMAIPIANAVIGRLSVPNETSYMLVCVASVITGGIFGDHCSPITDCTILSSLGAGCDNMDHVKTQMPYALTIAVVSVLCGTIPVALGLSVWMSLPFGFAILACVMRLAGKKPDAA